MDAAGNGDVCDCPLTLHGGIGAVFKSTVVNSDRALTTFHSAEEISGSECGRTAAPPWSPLRAAGASSGDVEVDFSVEDFAPLNTPMRDCSPSVATPLSHSDAPVSVLDGDVSRQILQDLQTTEGLDERCRLYAALMGDIDDTQRQHLRHCRAFKSDGSPGTVAENPHFFTELCATDSESLFPDYLTGVIPVDLSSEHGTGATPPPSSASDEEWDSWRRASPAPVLGGEGLATALPSVLGLRVAGPPDLPSHIMSDGDGEPCAASSSHDQMPRPPNSPLQCHCACGCRGRPPRLLCGLFVCGPCMALVRPWHTVQCHLCHGEAPDDVHPTPSCPGNRRVLEDESDDVSLCRKVKLPCIDVNEHVIDQGGIGTFHGDVAPQHNSGGPRPRRVQSRR